jgi:hypothetical protein
LALKKQRVFCPLEQLYSCMHKLILIHGYGLKPIYTFQVQPISDLDHGRKTAEWLHEVLYFATEYQFRKEYHNSVCNYLVDIRG